WAHQPRSMGAWSEEGPETNHDTPEMRAVIAGDGPILFAGQHLSPIGSWMEAAVRSSHHTLAGLYARVGAA
ncbi:MAG: hypothetical protein ACK46Q_10400, partial [Hyphomonas sp.]